MPTLDQRMNILLMGVDSNGVNTQRFVATRSDTMMLVSCDPVSKRVGVVIDSARQQSVDTRAW